MNSLSKTGLSMSQAQSISNLCNQRAKEIDNILQNVNNAEKVVTIGGKTYIETKGVSLPKNTSDLLNEKAKLHATQAFLMENIKAKENLLNFLKVKQTSFDVKGPEYPEIETYFPIKSVDETWGKNQLTIQELCDWLYLESFSAHIGQFIHQDGKLDKLRKELPKIKTLEFMSIKDGEKTPVEVKVHHTSEDLLKIHEELSIIHRDSEQKLNYLKAKVKNLVTLENARIAKENAIGSEKISNKNMEMLDEYKNKMSEHRNTLEKLNFEFEEKRNQEIQEASKLRIAVNHLFKDTIDMFLNNMKGEE